jgi:GT2 family glycosyltransferase
MVRDNIVAVYYLLPVIFFKTFLSTTAIKYDVKYELKDAAYDEIFSPPTVSGCFMLLSNVLLQKLNGFDERYFMYLEDVDLCRRALQANQNILLSWNNYCPCL